MQYFLRHEIFDNIVESHDLKKFYNTDESWKKANIR